MDVPVHLSRESEPSDLVLAPADIRWYVASHSDCGTIERHTLMAEIYGILVDIHGTSYKYNL